MICKRCNREVQEHSQFCPYCGGELNGVNNNFQGNSVQGENLVNNAAVKYEEKVNVWFAILSWFIPLAGLIIFFVKKDKEPKTAKVSGICALISFILNILVIFVVFQFIFSVADNVVNDVVDVYQDAADEIYEEYSDGDDVINDNDVISGDVTTDWKKYEVQVNGKTIVLPTSYSELSSATGFLLKSADSKSYLQGGYYTYLNLYKNDKLALYIDVLNNTDNDLLYTDCDITRISQSKYQVSQGADVIIFPGGLKAGESITEEKLLELFGTPNDIDEYSSDGYVSKTYKYTEDDTFTTTNNYEIKVVNGVIDQLQLDNRR